MLWIGLVVAAVLLVAVVGTWVAAQNFRRSVLGRVQAIQMAASAPEAATQLPPQVAAFVDRSGGSGQAHWVRFIQQGEMRLKPAGPWLPFTASQHVALARPAFVWHARLTMAGLPVQVMDALGPGGGRLEARLLGAVPVARAGGRETLQGQLLRYLAEMVWYPQAMVHTPGLTWEALDDARAQAHLTWGETTASAVFTFDESGDVVQVRTEARPRAEAGNALFPWGADLGDYDTVDGWRLPTRAVVWWELPEGRFEYWRGTTTAVHVE